jgi:N12 class adenine-specific DNA methylase
MAFNIQAARADGIPDNEIADHLAELHGFNIEAARKDGIPDTEIADHLSQKSTTLAKVKSVASDIFAPTTSAADIAASQPAVEAQPDQQGIQSATSILNGAKPADSIIQPMVTKDVLAKGGVETIQQKDPQAVLQKDGFAAASAVALGNESDSDRRSIIATMLADTQFPNKELAQAGYEHASNVYDSAVAEATDRIRRGEDADAVHAAFVAKIDQPGAIRNSPISTKPQGFYEITRNALNRALITGANTGRQMAAIGAGTAGATDTARGLLDEATGRSQDMALQYPSAIKSVTDSKNFGDAATRLYEGIIENAPMLITSVGAGIGGKALAELLTKKGASIAEKAVAGKIGAAAGAGAASIGMESGSIYNDIYNETGQMREGVALSFGAVAGALDAIPAFRLVGTLTKHQIAGEIGKTAIERYGVEGLKQLGFEAGTEGIQTLIEKGAITFVDGRPWINKENLLEALDAAYIGGGMGAGAHVASQAANDIGRMLTPKERALAEIDQIIQSGKDRADAIRTKSNNIPAGATPAEEVVQEMPQPLTPPAATTTAGAAPIQPVTANAATGTLDDTLDSFADEANSLPGSATGEAGKLHQVLKTASAQSVNTDGLIDAMKWSIENGRADIADAIISRLERSAASAETAKSGLPPTSKNYDASVSALKEAATNARDASNRAARLAKLLREESVNKPAQSGTANAVAPSVDTHPANGSILVKGFTKEQVSAVRDSLNIKQTKIGENGNAVFPKGTDIKAVKAALGVTDAPIQNAAKKKKTAIASSDLLQRIKQLGGINSKYASDITGEPRGVGGWKFAFNKNGLGLDDLATQLHAEGFNIDMNDDTDNGGVNQLAEMIRKHIGGERAFKHTSLEAKADASTNDAKHAYAYKLGINTRGLTEQELDDAIYMAEDAIEMAKLDAANNPELAAEVSDEIIDEIPFGDSVTTDSAALSAWLGEEDGQTGTASQAQEAVAKGSEAGTGSDGGTDQQARASEDQTGRDEQPILESYTNAEVAKREKAKAKAEEEANKDAPAKNVTADQPDMFNTQDALFTSNRDPVAETSSAQEENVKPIERIAGDKLETNLPEITYTTAKGKAIQGVIAKTLTKDQAVSIDKYTWKKDGGYFIRAKHVTRIEGDAVKAQEPAKVEQAKPSEFANNKIFTADKVEAARALLKKKLGTLNSGIDPEVLTAGMTLAGAHIEAGARTFSAFSKKMVEDFGDAIKPYLRSFYESVRHYPGLDTTGMTTASEIDLSTQQKEAVKPADVKAEEAKANALNPAIGEVTKTAPRMRERKTTDVMLKDDFGVTHIDGYGSEREDGMGGVKSEFLKDAKSYLTAVSKELELRGFAPFTDKKGKPQKAVSVNESGIASSGDVHISMYNAEAGHGIYITIGGSALRGTVATTKSGVAVMMRVNSKEDQYGTRGHNQWMPVNMTAFELAAKAEAAVVSAVKKPEAEKITKEEAFKAGQDAFHAGALRQAPVKFAVNHEAGRSWFNGWDTANLAEPVPELQTVYAKSLRPGDKVEFLDHVGGIFHPGDVAKVSNFTSNGSVQFERNGGGTGWIDAATLDRGQPERWKLIEKHSAKAQNESTGGTQDARPTQTEGVSTADTRSDSQGGAGRGRAGESLDAGMAETGGSTDRNGRVQGGVSVSSGAGTQPTGARDGVQPPNAVGGVRAVRPVIGTTNNDDHTITDELGKGGAVSKFKDNVAAIKILKALDAESRSATPEERKQLEKYVGFGALKSVFDKESKQWQAQYKELRELLTDEEYDSARASVLNAHYTSKAVVDSMYAAVKRMGFSGGRVLEPAMGSGNFFGMMPAGIRNNSNLFGVELDLLTSKLAKAMYPKANISVATGFQEFQVPAGFFDMAIGNPPFGSEPIVDKERSPYSGHSIHNYFIARMIDKVRDGGIVPVVVSHNFLDAINPRTRQWIAERANLVGAVRLPNTAFKENAGTEVVTDILFFQKTATPEKNPSWVDSSDVQINGETISLNKYFTENSHNILGKQTTAGSMYRANEYTVEPTGNLKEMLAGFVESLPANIYQPVERATDELDSADNTIPDGVKQGSYFLDSNGKIKQRGNDLAGSQTSSAWVPPNETAIQRMRGMIGLRDLLRAQMRMERDESSNTKAIEKHREKLNEAYDAFKKKFGFVNSQANRRIFMDDTEAALLQSIEFDYDKGVSETSAKNNDIDAREPSAKKADILQRRVLFPNVEKMNVASAKDALLASLDEKGRVDLEYMARAYNKLTDEIVEELGDVLYQDPATMDHVMADEYLSGDVKTKLDIAKKSAETDGRFRRNVEALEKVIPADKLPSQIFASLGAGWIPEDVFNEFAKEMTGAQASMKYLAATAQWLGETPTGTDIGKMNADFGTDKLSSFELFKLLMNAKTPEVKKRIMRDGNEAYVTDEEATEAAREKANKIRSTWETWVWADGVRAERLAGIFNDKHNRIVKREFDGSHLVLHGSTPTIKMRKSQLDAIWRMIQDRVVLLDHVVGAGKTFAIVAAVMEMKRLGIARKPIIIVPNHLTMMWRSDFSRLYPAANVLAATPEDFSKGNRERMFSKIALGEYDAVIIGHSSLNKIGLDATIEQGLVKEQIDEITDAIEAAKRERGDKGIVRDMEKIKKNLEAKIAELIKKAGERDKVVTFDELGVDAMMVDEMHEFKNLFFVSQMQRVAGLGNPKGSGKAFDMFGKIRWLQNTYGTKAPLITATGTPVSNSLAEMFTMQRYMKYSELKEDGLHLFDAWARMYGDVESLYEVAPSGVGYRISQRFSKFKNLPSLMAHYNTFADTVTMQDLKDNSIAEGKVFPVPKMVGGKPQNIVAKRSEAQSSFFGVPHVRRDEAGNIVYEMDYHNATIEPSKDGEKWILSDGHRSITHETREDAEIDLVSKSLAPVLDLDPNSLLGQFANLSELSRKSKGKINALSLTGLASKAGLDMRIIYPDAPDFEGSKINKAVAEMMRVYKKWTKDKGAQLVFCDLSVPASARANMESKERRLYVMDQNGLLTHKKGTLHTVEGYEGFPFYLVKTGKKDSINIDIYEPVTGSIIKSGFKEKAAAKAFLAETLKQERNRDKWLELRDSKEAITPEHISEYRDENGLEVDEDGSNEVSMDDLESVAGSAQFSVYDDIKAKLIANGVPEKEIAFIHDYDTPAKKAELFKAVNRGDVRFMLGSTPKMGAGTNVQQRLVGLHHIDAPWRPSDLEQREGRIIRQGNLLYERDPDGFEVFVGRYATEQTYDTRRWQLLEHKASGIEQLRKYNGQLEIEDVAGEAANSADMKAAASGNPLILEETKLRNEVKRLTALQRGHADSTFAMQRKLSHERNRVSTFLPRQIASANEIIGSAKSYPHLKGKDEISDISIDGKKYKSKGAAEDALATLAQKVRVGERTVGHIIYRGVNFDMKMGYADHLSLHTDISEIAGYNSKDVVSGSGMVTRFENFIEGMTERKERIEAELEKAKGEIKSMESRVNAPFEDVTALEKAKADHSKVQRKLMKATQIDAVPPEERASFLREQDARKEGLIDAGYGKALHELDNDSATFSKAEDADAKKEAVETAVDDDFLGIVDRMKKAGLVDVNCD